MAITLLLIVVAVAILYLLGASQTTTYGTTATSQSVQALMAAESGLERARGIVKQGVEFGVDATACEGFDTTTTPTLTPPELGGGSFSYSPFTSLPLGCNNLTCTGCKIGVVGMMGPASRTIASEITYAATNGVEGNGDVITFKLTTTVDGSGVVSNVAYRSRGSGGNANVTGCTETGALPGTCTRWNIRGEGNWNISATGIYATVPSRGTYTVTVNLSDVRHYVAVGAIFPPTSSAGSVTFKGQYGVDTGSPSLRTISRTDLTGGTTNTWCASGADTLVFGFSSEPSVAGSQLNGVTFGTTPLQRLVAMNGSLGDGLYSEIWYVHNAAGIASYFTGNPTPFTISGATPGDDWASGFICLAGVDPTKVKRLGRVALRPTIWYEPI